MFYRPQKHRKVLTQPQTPKREQENSAEIIRPQQKVYQRRRVKRSNNRMIHLQSILNENQFSKVGDQSESGEGNVHFVIEPRESRKVQARIGSYDLNGPAYYNNFMLNMNRNQSQESALSMARSQSIQNAAVPRKRSKFRAPLHVYKSKGSIDKYNEIETPLYKK